MLSDDFISSLLFEAEGAELDFKRDQYPFSGQDDQVKSELLKDILAFANAWRRSDAYILIGIEEVKGAEAKLIGITEHLDDACLQQFVNSKTNRPVEFSYTPTPFRGRQIGVIHIPLQDRPTFLKKDYGKLSRNNVYLRRGSSTDEASPDEIARMGLAASDGFKLRPLLIPKIATGSDFTGLSEVAKFQAVQPINLEIESLPDYSTTNLHHPAGTLSYISVRHDNADYYRDRAEYLRFLTKMRPIRFAICNEGTALASGVKLTAHISDPAHLLEFTLGSSKPREPRKKWSPLDTLMPSSMSKTASDIEVTKTNEGWKISAYFGRIQAKDTKLTSEQLFVGMSQSGTIELPTLIFADELSTPVNTGLLINFEVTEKEIPYDILTS